MLSILRAWVKANGPFDISLREALAAPTTDEETYIQSVVILTLSVVSAMAAGWILLSFAVSISQHLLIRLDLLTHCSGFQATTVLQAPAYPVCPNCSVKDI